MKLFVNELNYHARKKKSEGENEGQKNRILIGLTYSGKRQILEIHERFIC